MKQNSRVFEDEFWWLCEKVSRIERQPLAEYLAPTKSGETKNPWQAYKFKTQREAEQFKLNLLRGSDQFISIEHCFTADTRASLAGAK